MYRQSMQSQRSIGIDTTMTARRLASVRLRTTVRSVLCRQASPAAGLICSALFVNASTCVAGSFPAVLDLSTLDGTNGFVIPAVDGGDDLGRSVARAGDINGDGIEDLLIGAAGAVQYRGTAYVVFGRAAGFPAELDLASLDGANGFVLKGDESQQAIAGESVSGAGDVNGDGFDDLIVGAPWWGSNLTFVGKAYVVFGRAPPASPRSWSWRRSMGPMGLQSKMTSPRSSRVWANRRAARAM
jgi:hypothetical protein